MRSTPVGRKKERRKRKRRRKGKNTEERIQIKNNLFFLAVSSHSVVTAKESMKEEEEEEVKEKRRSRARKSLEAQTLEIRSRGEVNLGLVTERFVTLPTFALATKLPKISFVIGIPHGPVALWRAKITLFLVELLVTTVKKVDLRIVKSRVMFLVTLSIDVTEETREIWPTFPREFAMEHEYTSFTVVRLNFGCVSQGIEKTLLYEVLAVEIESTLNVATVVLVRISTIDYREVVDLVLEVPAHQRRQRIRGNRFKILVFTLRQW